MSINGRLQEYMRVIGYLDWLSPSPMFALMLPTRSNFRSVRKVPNNVRVIPRNVRISNRNIYWMPWDTQKKMCQLWDRNRNVTFYVNDAKYETALNIQLIEVIHEGNNGQLQRHGFLSIIFPKTVLSTWINYPSSG